MKINEKQIENKAKLKVIKRILDSLCYEELDEEQRKLIFEAQSALYKVYFHTTMKFK